MTINHNTYIGTLLKQKNIITDNQLEKALHVRKAILQQLGQPVYLGRVIVELGFASEAEVVNTINEYYSLSVTALSENIEALIHAKQGTLLKRLFAIGIPIWMQLSIAAIFIIVFTIIALSAVILKQQKKQLYDQTVKIGMVSLNYFSNNAGIPILEDNILGLNTLIKEAGSVEGIRYAIIVDKNEMIKAHTDFNKIGMMFEPFKQVESITSKEDTTYFNYTSHSGEQLLNLTRPLKFQDKYLGEVHVGVSIDFIEQMISEKKSSIIAVTSIILFVGIVISVLMGLRFSRPVSKLVAATKEIAKGNYQHKVDLVRNDELGRLARSFNTMSHQLWQKSLMEKSFGKYVGSEVLQLIMSNPKHGWLKGKRSEATILFTDIRGFTAYSEANEPEHVVEELNRYFEVITRVIHRYGGYVDKFIGDAVLAVFGVPVYQEDHMERAVRSAVEMQKKLKQTIQNEDSLLRAVGISMNAGVVVSGNIGSQMRMEYTVIGDSVNIASRLNGFAGPGEIIISKSIFLPLKDMIEVEILPPQHLKGKSGTFEIFKVLSIKETFDDEI